MNTGVDALFEDAGNKYLDPSFQQKVMQEQEANKEEISNWSFTVTKILKVRVINIKFKFLFNSPIPTSILN